MWIKRQNFGRFWFLALNPGHFEWMACDFTLKPLALAFLLWSASSAGVEDASEDFQWIRCGVHENFVSHTEQGGRGGVTLARRTARWCAALTLEVNGDEAWRTCKFEVLNFNPDRRRSISIKDIFETFSKADVGPDYNLLWLNAREIFPGANTYATASSAFSFENSTRNFSHSFDFQEECVAVNVNASQVFKLPCRQRSLPALCVEMSVLLTLRASGEGVGEDDQLVSAEPLVGLFHLHPADTLCPWGVGVLVFLPQRESCHMGAGGNETVAWYNGLLRSEEHFSIEGWGWPCLLCREDGVPAPPLPLQIALRRFRGNLGLESFPSSMVLQEPFCVVSGAPPIRSLQEVRNFTRDLRSNNTLQPAPMVMWCFQRGLDGQFAISNRILVTPDISVKRGNQSHILIRLLGNKAGVKIPLNAASVSSTSAATQHLDANAKITLDFNAGCSPTNSQGQSEPGRDTRGDGRGGAGDWRAGACLRRLCLAASGCRLHPPCDVDACGPFALSERLWQSLPRPFAPPLAAALAEALADARRHSHLEELTGGPPGPRPHLSFKPPDFWACAQRPACAAEAAWAASATKDDCDGDGVLTCGDRAAVLFDACHLGTPTLRPLAMARYWRFSRGGGEPVVLNTTRFPYVQTSCTHGLFFGRHWVHNIVNLESIRTVSFGRFGSVNISVSEDTIQDKFLALSEGKKNVSLPVNVALLGWPFSPQVEYDVHFIDEDALNPERLSAPMKVAPTEATPRAWAEAEQVVAAVEAAAAAAGTDAEADRVAVQGAVGAADALLVQAEARGAAARELGALPALLERLVGRVALPADAPLTQVGGAVALGAARAGAARGFALSCGASCDGDFRGAQLRALAPSQNAPSREVSAAAVLPRSLALPPGARVAFAAFADAAAFPPPEGAPRGKAALAGAAGTAGGWSLNSPVVGLALWAADGSALPLPRGAHVDLLLRPAQAHAGKGAAQKVCVYWDTGAGLWSGEGCELLAEGGGGGESPLDTCRCRHLSHFAQLVTNSAAGAHSKALQVVSVTGCALSLCGIAGIWVVAVAVPHWRHKTENKVLLGLSCAVALTMSAFLAAALRPPPSASAPASASCRVLGAVLHYAVLASFCWSLAAAYAHYLRLATVAGPGGVRRLVLKASLLAWGLPLLLALPVALLGGAGASRGFCYPEGAAFYGAVLAPVALALAVNTVVFALVLRTLGLLPCCRAPYQLAAGAAGAAGRSRSLERRILVRKVLVCVAFVFLFGLTWLLGVFAASIVFAYLFCITATLQGLVLFVFFALGEQRVRQRVGSAAFAFRGRLRPVARPSGVAGKYTATTSSASGTASTDAPASSSAASQRTRTRSLPELAATPHARESHL